MPKKKQTPQQNTKKRINATSRDWQGNNCNRSTPDWTLGSIDTGDDTPNFWLEAKEGIVLVC